MFGSFKGELCKPEAHSEARRPVCSCAFKLCSFWQMKHRLLHHLHWFAYKNSFIGTMPTDIISVYPSASVKLTRVHWCTVHAPSHQRHICVAEWKTVMRIDNLRNRNERTIAYYHPRTLAWIQSVGYIQTGNSQIGRYLVHWEYLYNTYVNFVYWRVVYIELSIILASALCGYRFSITVNV